MMTEKRKNIAFFHPDLGIGGAERLIIDAAVGLQDRGHKVVIFTSYCDPKHCFDEARDGTLDVRVRGDWLIPSSILSRFSILCAILRQFHLIVGAYFSSELGAFKPDAFVVDQLSAGLPWLRFFFPKTRILFYCHFPDLLLAQGRGALLKRIYRIPFDFIEEWSMGFADSICVNSGFTRSMVSKEFPQLARSRDLQIVYPCVNVNIKKDETADDIVPAWNDRDILLSINRFEKKKDVGLAIKAFAGLGKAGREATKTGKGSRLVLAGGYDSRVTENVVCHEELVALAESLGLKTATTKTIVTALNIPNDVDVLFLLSVPNTLKEMLLKSAKLLIYTPSDEHFGIVPLEAMLAGVPVLAANTGGPLETVVDGTTGWLCPPNNVQKWTAVMENVLHFMSDEQVKTMGKAGVDRVKKEFSETKMAERFDELIDDMAGRPRRGLFEIPLLFITLAALSVDSGYYYALQNDVMREQLSSVPLPPFLFTGLSMLNWLLYFVSGYAGGTANPSEFLAQKKVR